MGVCYLRSLNDSVVVSCHSERDVVLECIVKKNGFLVHIADKVAQIVYCKFFYIDTVNQYFAFLHIVIARNKVEQCRLSATTLSNKCNGFAFRNNQINVTQNPLWLCCAVFFCNRIVCKTDVTELYLAVESLNMLGLFHFFNAVFCHQYLVNSFHRSQSFCDVVARF